MKHPLRKQLDAAVGASEYVISVYLDIRGYTKFSQTVDSVEVGTFIKHAYIGLIDKYFSHARFIKPTGDGLLVIFSYTENTLGDVATRAVSAALEAVGNFETLVQGNALINFKTRKNLGIGVSRGSACRIDSNRRTLDYSGKIINASAKLMNIARPKGVVLDPSFEISILEESIRKRFQTQDVYFRAMDDSHQLKIFVSEDVKIDPDLKRAPTSLAWHKQKVTLKVSDLKLKGPRFQHHFDRDPVDQDEVRVQILFPKVNGGKKVSGITVVYQASEFKLLSAPQKPGIAIRYDEIFDYLKSQKCLDNWKIEIEISYQVRVDPNSRDREK